MSVKASQRIRSKRRSGVPWVSTNRVLIGNPSSKKSGNFARNPNFDTDETKLLIQLWGDPKVQRTLITTHKKQAVIAQLAAKMEDYGYYRSPEEITTRIKNLKCFYNRLKKEIDAGQTTPTEQTWKHFVEMDAIMTRPIFSVRPNEVPAPSLRFQLEQAREEREARRKEILEAGGSMSGSEDGLEDLIALSNHHEDECVLSDVEIHLDDNESLSALVASNEPKCILTRGRRGRKRRKLSKSHSESSLANVSDYMGEPDGDAATMTKANEGPALQIKDERSIDNAEFDGKSPANEEKEPPGQLNTSATAGAMLVPKEEPIDVDDDDDAESMDKVQQQSVQTSANIKGIMPSIADLLSMSQGSTSAMLIPVSSIANMQSCPPVTTAVAPMSTATYTSSTNRPPAGSQTPKISIVPANFLMHAAKSSTVTSTTTSSGGGVTSTVGAPQLHLLQNSTQLNGQPMTQRILLSSGGGQGSATAGPKTGIVTTGIGGMKVLLVNADQSAALGGAPQQIGSAAGHLSHQLTAGNLQVNATLSSQGVIQATQQQPTTTQQQLRQQPQNKQKRQGEPKLYQPTQQQSQQQEQEELISKKEATSIRILLRNLLNVQMENNNIENQRLKLEREKFEFEKSCAERFFGVLPSLVTQMQFNQNPLQQPQTQPPPHLQLHLQKTPQQQLSTQLRLSAPPKLVFASTGTVASNLSINNAASATVIVPTTSNTPGITISQAPLTSTTVTNGSHNTNTEPKIIKLEKED